MSLDPADVMPFVLFLGMTGVNMTKELDNLVIKEMSEDEALLYSQAFHREGFSQAQFKRLLSCPSCKWGVAQPGEVLNSSDPTRLKLIVRGSARVAATASGAPAVDLPAPTSIGATRFLRGRDPWRREVVEARLA
ncbi:unnamed protein product, partial [Prorocentrum cordatum]